LDDVSRSLQRFLDSKNAHGFPKYSPRAVRDCLVLLVMSTEEISPEELSEPLQRLLGQFAMEIGFIGPGATSDKLEPLVDGYFEKHAPDIWLLEEMRAALHEGLQAREMGGSAMALVN